MSVLRRIGPRPVLLARSIVHHFVTKLRHRRLRSTYDAKIASAPGGVTLNAPAIDLPRLADLPAALVPAAERLIAEAGEVCAHRVEYLGSGPVELGPEIDWQRDFKSGYRWDEDFYQDVEVTRLTDASDAKVPWELSRGHQLLTLARAARLTGDERYLAELEAQLASWLDANPPGQGINWTNAMEVAIRAVNWVWAIGTAEGERPLEPGLRARVVESLSVHGRHIAANLEATPYLRSNHYMADLLGLSVLGGALEGDPQARRWSRLAARELEREIVSQVGADGLGAEASVPYHGLVLEMLVVARAEAARTGGSPSRRFDGRLRSMLLASRALRHPGGRIPQLGDGDSGRILPAGFGREPTHDNLLWLGAAVLDCGRPLEGDPDPEVAWTFGVSAWERVGSLEPVAGSGSVAFRDAGVYVLRSGEAHAVLRCGHVGQGGNGGHAHNDSLSYELSYDGTPLVVDPGTYVYTSDPDARNEFRSTRAHSTVVVDGEEINPVDPAALFRLAQVASPVLRRFEPGRVEAEHDGYARLPGAPVHRRSLALRAGRAHVCDAIAGSGDHALESLVHLAAGTEVERAGENAFDLRRDGLSARIEFSGVDGVEVEQGWVSDGFGAREHAPVLVARAARTLPARLEYTIDRAATGVEAPSAAAMEAAR
jgi:hypothetical protein